MSKLKSEELKQILCFEIEETFSILKEFIYINNINFLHLLLTVPSSSMLKWLRLYFKKIIWLFATNLHTAHC